MTEVTGFWDGNVVFYTGLSFPSIFLLNQIYVTTATVTAVAQQAIPGVPTSLYLYGGCYAAVSWD